MYAFEFKPGGGVQELFSESYEKFVKDIIILNNNQKSQIYNTSHSDELWYHKLMEVSNDNFIWKTPSLIYPKDERNITIDYYKNI